MRASRVLRARDDENNAYFTRQTSCHVVDKAESRVDHFSEISLPPHDNNKSQHDCPSFKLLPCGLLDDKSRAAPTMQGDRAI